MDMEPLQVQLSPPDNPSHSSTKLSSASAPISCIPLPPKIRSRRSRKKGTRVKKLSVDLNINQSATSSITPNVPDSNYNDADQICPPESIMPEKLDHIKTDAVPLCGEEKQPFVAFSQSQSRVLDEGTSFNTPLSERAALPRQHILPCTPSTIVIENPGITDDEPTDYRLPLCEGGAFPYQQKMPSSQQAYGIELLSDIQGEPPNVMLPLCDRPSFQCQPMSNMQQVCGIREEPPTFMLPLCDRPSLQCQQMSNSQQVSGITPPGFSMKIVHFGPPPHLLPMAQFFGHPPLVAPFQPQHTPMARLMGPSPPVGHFVAPPHHFLRTPNPTNTYFRPVFWNPQNPYGAPHPYANTIMPTQMPYPGYALGPQRRRPPTAKPRKPRRKTSSTCAMEPEENTVGPPLNMSDETFPQVTLDEMSPQETSTVNLHETFPQDTVMFDTSSQEPIMEVPLPQETIIIDTPPLITIMDDEVSQGTIMDEPLIHGTIIDEPPLPQASVTGVSMDVPDMCNEVEVESSLSFNDGFGQNGEEDTFSRNMSMHSVSLDLNHIDMDRQLSPPSPTPVKTRRMSHKKDHMKLVFDRKSDAMVKAAKGLFTKRTRTLYTWLYPNTSKREVKMSVSKAWDLLPESEKAYYLAQVDGRLGIHPGLMVNPQLEGLVKLPEGSATFGSRSRVRASSESSDYGSSDLSETDQSNSEAARAVRHLFASNGDVETWTSFAHNDEADNKRFRRRKRRKSSEMDGNSADDAAGRSKGTERDAELECELTKFRQILENDNNLNDEDSYWRAVPEPNPDELFLDIIQE